MRQTEDISGTPHSALSATPRKFPALPAGSASANTHRYEAQPIKFDCAGVKKPQ